MNIESVELTKAYVLLNHGPVTLVSAAHNGQKNVMAASWVMPLDFDPPKVALVIDKSAHSRQIIEASGELVLSIPSKSIAKKVLAIGSVSGKDQDKFTELDIGIVEPKGKAVGAPLIEGCVAWLHCRVIPEPHNQQTYDLFIAEVIHAWSDTRAFKNGRWEFEDDSLKTIHYVAGGMFFETGDGLEIE